MGAPKQEDTLEAQRNDPMHQQVNTIVPHLDGASQLKNATNKIMTHNKLQSRQVGARFSQPSVQSFAVAPLGQVSNNTQKPSSVDRT